MKTDQDNGWLSAHLFYQGELDDLLVHAVAPLVRELASNALIDDYFFLRYWDGGPHVRLRVRPAEGVDPEDLRSPMSERLDAYFGAHPSADRMRPGDYRRMAKDLADREGLATFSEHIYPNNSLAFIPYRREHHVYGRGTSMRTVEEHFGESSRIALGMLTAGTPPDQRDTAAFCMLVFAWCCAPPPVREERARLDADSADFDAPYRRQRDRLVAAASRVRAMAVAPPDESGVLAAWGRSVLRLRDRLDEDERASAVLDMCAHLLCNRLGISLPEEFYLRYLARRAMADISEGDGNE